jgi:hypothetical protein
MFDNVFPIPTEYLKLVMAKRGFAVDDDDAKGRVLRILDEAFDAWVTEFNKRTTKSAIWMDVWNRKKRSYQKIVNLGVADAYRRTPVGEEPDFGDLRVFMKGSKYFYKCSYDSGLRF